jgi:hypothetical protein
VRVLGRATRRRRRRRRRRSARADGARPPTLGLRLCLLSAARVLPRAAGGWVGPVREEGSRKQSRARARGGRAVLCVGGREKGRSRGASKEGFALLLCVCDRSMRCDVGSRGERREREAERGGGAMPISLRARASRLSRVTAVVAPRARSPDDTKSAAPALQPCSPRDQDLCPVDPSLTLSLLPRTYPLFASIALPPSFAPPSLPHNTRQRPRPEHPAPLSQSLLCRHQGSKNINAARFDSRLRARARQRAHTQRERERERERAHPSPTPWPLTRSRARRCHAARPLSSLRQP